MYKNFLMMKVKYAGRRILVAKNNEAKVTAFLEEHFNVVGV